MDEAYIDIMGINTYYRVAGDGQPVVLIHGLGANWEMWGKLIPSLGKRFKVYAPDLPGCGKSDKPDVSYDIAFYTGFLVSYLEIMGLQKVILIGESLGAHLAVKIAIERPELVDKLVIVSSCGLTSLFHGIFRIPLVSWIFTYIAGHWDSFNGWFYRKFFADKHYVTEAVLRDYLGRLKLPGAKRAYYRTLSATKAKEKGLMDKLCRINCPTLTIWGRDDQVEPIKAGWLLADNIKNSTLAVIYNCGHVPPVEKYREFNRAVLDFLR